MIHLAPPGHKPSKYDCPPPPPPDYDKKFLQRQAKNKAAEIQRADNNRIQIQAWKSYNQVIHSNNFSDVFHFKNQKWIFDLQFKSLQIVWYSNVYHFKCELYIKSTIFGFYLNCEIFSENVDLITFPFKGITNISNILILELYFLICQNLFS